MIPSITLDELLKWNNESSNFWKAYLDANPELLALPCGIGGAANVQEFVKHIWAVELRWAYRIAGFPVIAKDDLPEGPLDALYQLHQQAEGLFRMLLDGPAEDWDRSMQMDLPWLPPDARTASRRKVGAHALFHSQRHWAQLATLTRSAGFPSGFKGDLLFSSSLA
jgi:uncharacterized damage-inducible protein DinB